MRRFFCGTHTDRPRPATQSPLYNCAATRQSHLMKTVGDTLQHRARRAFAWRIWVACVAIVALLMVGLGHNRPALQQDAQATAYVLAGGSWDDLCGQPGDPRHMDSTACQACLISHSCLLDAPLQSALRVATNSTRVWPSHHTNHDLSQLDWAYAPRAPPLA